MADGGEPDGEAAAGAALAPGDEILVTVDSALPDVLVVSYRTAAKNFQGALLDAAKRGLPCGIQPPEPVKGPDADKLATVAARFSYFQEKRYNTLTKAEQRRVHPPARSKNTRPTVRLRPRQVLCSKCRSICNENSENVGRKRKLEEASSTPEQPIRRSDRRCSSTQQQQSQNPPPHQHAQNTRSQRLLAASTNDNQSDESSSSKTTTSSRQSEVSTRSAAKLGATLIPKISRLRPAEIGSAMQTSSSLKSSIQLAEQVRSAYWKGRDEEDLAEAAEQEEVENRPMNALAAEPMELDSNPTQAYCATPRRLSSSSVESAKVPPDEEDKKTLAAADSTVKTGRAARVQRKKHSIGLMEDLWDESVFEDTARTTTTTSTSNTATPTTARATPVIKISFGAQGEGTVLKIPSKIQHPYPGRDIDTDTEEAQTELDHDPLEMLRNGYDGYNGHCDIGANVQRGLDAQALLIKECETASSKAAKKALKKAKKKALRKMYEAASPARSPCNGSPRYNVNFEKMSQLYHRRKHKMKHKKKHKEERKHKSSSSNIINQQLDRLVAGTNGESMMMDMVAAAAPRTELSEHEEHEAYTAIKEQCLKQKLSISLKRLNTNAYAPSYPVSNASSGCKSHEASSEDEEEMEHEEEEANAETAPDFPPPEHPLVMRLSAAATPVEACLSAAGRRMDVGDVVWGKVHGFPWWPGKVLSITDSCKEDGTAEPQAHVAWYGSSTSSLMSCDQLSPFLETFKTRYNKKKKGPYKEAIRQAQTEARSQIAPNSTSSVLDVCSSPREVNVLS